VVLIYHRRQTSAMKQIHIWPSHVNIEHVDHVIFRDQNELLSSTLAKLSRLGFDTRPGNVEIHGEVLVG
jgi:hypothetical protein